MILSWDFKDAKTKEDVFVNVDGVNTNMMDLIKGKERIVFNPNPLSAGTYTACLTVAIGELFTYTSQFV